MADHLGVHYMTAYRYIRLGLLPATKRGNTWQVSRDDLADFERQRVDIYRGSKGPALPEWSRRYRQRLMAGDATGAWSVVHSCRASGVELMELYLDVISPAATAIGADPAAAGGNLAADHEATMILRQHLGRLSAGFLRAGRHRGTVVLGCAPGNFHDIGVTMVADLFTAAGFQVRNLGANTPIQAFHQTLEGDDRVQAVGLSLSAPDQVVATAQLVADIRALRDDVPIVVGGRAVGDLVGDDLGADLVTESGAYALTWLEARSTPNQSGAD